MTMALRADPRQILDNLLEFKAVVVKKKQFTPVRIYNALLNQKTGALHFAEEVKELEEEVQKEGWRKAEWKIVKLVVSDTATEGASFRLLDVEGNELDYQELSEGASKIAHLTISFLNQHGHGKKNQSAEETALQDLSLAKIQIVPDEVVNHSAWRGPISRLEAEQLLMDAPPGSYLLRMPENISEAMRVLFSEEEKRPVGFYLLTISEGDRKISEKLIVKYYGYFIYNDEPELSIYEDKAFPSLVALLESLDVLRLPLQG